MTSNNVIRCCRHFWQISCPLNPQAFVKQPFSPLRWTMNNNNRLQTLRHEILTSTDLILRKQKLNYLLFFAPLAIIGKSLEWFGESSCFVLAGLALIPLAEVRSRFFVVFAAICGAFTCYMYVMCSWWQRIIWILSVHIQDSRLRYIRHEMHAPNTHLIHGVFSP